MTGLGDWLLMMEETCLRAGKLREYLEKDKQRVLRRMETMEEDRILTNIQPMWEEKLPCGWIADDDPISEGMTAVGGFPVTTHHSQYPLVGEGGN